MTQPPNLINLEHRSRQYWNIDGLPELGMGLLWIVWGGAWLFGQSLPKGGASQMYWMFAPVLLVVTGLASTWAVRKLKARITFPRTGYVEWKEPTRTHRLGAAALAIAAGAAIAGLAVARRRVDGFAPLAAPALGVLLSLGFVGASVTQRAPHLLVLGGVALALGVAFGRVDAGWEAMNWLFVALGAVTALAGALRLRLFLKRNPLEAQA